MIRCTPGPRGRNPKRLRLTEPANGTGLSTPSLSARARSITDTTELNTSAAP